MKKFFKALAVVLALTLVIGTIPAAADVTIDATKVKKEKILYLGGTKGFKTEADGTKKMSRYGEKASYWRLLGITKEQAEELGVTATTSKEEVASVNDTSMKVKAQAMGTAKVTLKAGDASYEVAFTVKKSASSVIFGDDFAGVTESKDITINTEYVLSVPRFDNGVKMDTDQRTMTITDKDGKDVTADFATKKVDEKDPKKDTRTWTVKFTKAGAYTVKAWAYQSAKYFPGATAEKSITVNVTEPTPIEIKQTASDTFEIKFDADIEKLGYYKDAHDWDDEGTDGKIANRVYYKVGGVVVPFSSVKSTTPKEDKLIVVMYGAFEGGTEYFADIAGKTLSFVGAGNKAKDVASIAITKKTAVANIATPIEYKLYNAAGVDITKTAQAPEDINGNVTFTTEASTAFIGADNTIYFSKVGDKADVKGTFTFYDPDDNYKANEKTTTEVIVAVSEDVTTYVSADWSIGGGWWDGVHYLPMQDPDQGLAVRAKFQKGTEVFYAGIGDVIKYIEKPLQVKVSDEHFGIIKGAATVAAVNEGKSNFVLFYTTDDDKEIVLGTLPFEITAARKPTRVSSTAVNKYTGLPYLNLTDLGAVDDAIIIKTSLYDQYGTRMTGRTIKFTDRAEAALNAEFTTAAAIADRVTAGSIWSDDEWEITLADFTVANIPENTEKMVAFNVTIENITSVVSFRVKKAGDRSAANVKDVVYASGSALDTKLTTGANYGDAKNVSMRINKMIGNYFVGTQQFDLSTAEIKANKDVTDYTNIQFYDATGADAATGSAYVAKITFNGAALGVTGAAKATALAPKLVGRDFSAITPYGAVNAVDLATSVIFATTAPAPGADNAYAWASRDTLVFDAFDLTNADKLAVGSYNVIFYKITDAVAGDDKSKYEVLGSRGVTVKDSQDLPSFKQISQTVAAANDAAINDAYEFYWDGAVVDPANITFQYQDNGDAIYVYNAEVVIDYSLNAQTDDISATTYKLVVPVKELLKVK